MHSILAAAGSQTNTAAIVVTVAVVASMPVIIRAIKGFTRFRVDPKDPTRFAGVGRRYRIESYTGRAHGISKGSSTTYYGRADGYGGTSLQSNVVIRDQFFLRSPDGREISVQLAGFDAAVAEGHLVSVAWAVKGHSKKGRYFVVYNHTTQTSRFNREVLYKIAISHYERGITVNLLLIIFVLPVIIFMVWMVAIRIQQRRFVSTGVVPLEQHFRDVACAQATALPPQVIAPDRLDRRPPPPSPVPAEPPAPVATAGWLPDPTHRHHSRYWDGSTWTGHVSDDGVVSVDTP